MLNILEFVRKKYCIHLYIAKETEGSHRVKDSEMTVNEVESDGRTVEVRDNDSESLKVIAKNHLDRMHKVISFCIVGNVKYP